MKIAVAIAIAALCLIGAMFLLRRDAAPAAPAPRPAPVTSPTPLASPGPAPTPSEEPKETAPAAEPRKLAVDLARALRDGDENAVRAILKSLHDLLHPPVADADNAAIVYQKAFDLAAQKMGGLSMKGFDRDAYSAAITGKELSAEQRARLREWFDKNGPAADEVIALFVEAGRKTECRFPELDQQRITRLGYASNFLRVAALVRQEEGKADDAAEIGRASLALARATRSSPDLTSQLLGASYEFLSVDAMQRTLDPSSPKLAAALDATNPAVVRDAYRRALLGDLDWTVASALKWRSDPASAPNDDVRRWAQSPLAMQDVAAYVEGMGDFLRLAGRPYHEIRGEMEALVRQYGEFAPWYASLARQTIPAVPGLTRTIAKSEAAMTMAKLSLDLERYRAKNGSYPATLDALQTAPPRDPFTGQPFAYRKEGGGFVLESPGGAGGKDAVTWRSR